MINLLPLAHKKETKKEYTRRFIVVFGLFFVAGAVIAMIFCLILFYRADAYFKETEKVLELAKKVSSLNKMENLENRIDDLDRLLTTYKDGISRRNSPSFEISLILSVLPKGIALNSFAFDGEINDKTDRSVRLTGIADTREIFLSFVEALRKISSFAEVESPVSNLLKEKVVGFSLNIKLAQPQKKNS